MARSPRQTIRQTDRLNHSLYKDYSEYILISRLEGWDRIGTQNSILKEQSRDNDLFFIVINFLLCNFLGTLGVSHTLANTVNTTSSSLY